MHPELALEEHRTSDILAARLEALGAEADLEIRRNVGGTGIVASLTGTKPAPASGPGSESGSGSGSELEVRAVGLRADMDALPMEEDADASTRPHRSTVPGKFHGCGHDGHSTMLLGTAQYLAKNRHLFRGVVRFIFQPAEEAIGGAALMVKAGLFRDAKMRCDEVYGIHNWPYVTPGAICVRPGPIMASADEWDVSVQGVGGHAAMPHLCVDPIAVGAQLVTALQAVVARQTNPLHAVVLSVTKFAHAGSAAYNVTPDAVTLSGTVRAFTEEDRDSVELRLRRTAESICAAAGAKATVAYRRGYPPTVNAEAQAGFARQAALATVGPEKVLTDVDPTMGAEDFSFMLREVPGAYVWIGGKSQGGLHQPSFDFDDDMIPVGVQYFANLVQQRLA